MDLQTRKISFVQEFLRIQNEEVISGLEKMLQEQRAALYEKSLQPMSLEQFNTDIDQSIDDSENNKVISSKDLKKEIEKWN